MIRTDTFAKISFLGVLCLGLLAFSLNPNNGIASAVSGQDAAENLRVRLADYPNTRVGIELASIINSKNDERASLVAQRDAICYHLRVEKHYGGDPKLLRKGEEFQREGASPSVYSLSGSITADNADAATKRLFDLLFASEKVFMKVASSLTATTSTRFSIQANLEDHGISEFQPMIGTFNSEPTSVLRIVVSKQSKFSPAYGAPITFEIQGYPNWQGIIVSMYPDNPKLLEELR